MAMAPFREFLALVILDGDFDLPQHLSVDPAVQADQIAEIVFHFKEPRASGRYIFIKDAPFRSHFPGYESFS